MTMQRPRPRRVGTTLWLALGLSLGALLAACGDDPAPAPTCPSVQPKAGAACAAELTCDYGQACCCGTCLPTATCACVDGAWTCEATGACAEISCSAGCALDEWSTPGGCLTCEALREDLSDALTAAAQARGACARHADCRVLTPALPKCGGLCAVAVASGSVDAFTAEAQGLGNSWCGTTPPTGYCPAEVAACEEAQLAACVEGVCVPLVSCAEPPEGVTDVCDDANPCTADSCGASGECQHAPTAGPCDGPCQVGGACEAGACVVQGPSAWQRVDEQALAQTGRAVVVTSTGDLVVGGTETDEGGERVRLSRWTAAGEPVSSVTFEGAGVARLVALAAAADGGVALLAETRTSAGETPRAWFAVVDAAGEVIAEHLGEPAVQEIPLALAGAGAGPFYVGVYEAGPAVRALDAAGEVVWTRALGNGAAGLSLAAVEGGVLAAASLEDGLHLLRIEPDGEGGSTVAWDQPVEAEGPDVARAPRVLEALPDGGFFVAGLRDDYATDPVGTSGFVTLYDAAGEAVGDRVVQARPLAGALTAQGDLILAGVSTASGELVWYGRFGATDAGPEALATQAWPSAGLSRIVAGVAAAPGGFVLGGHTSGEAPDLWLMRVADDCDTSPCELEGCAAPVE